MRHRRKGRILGRKPNHQRALLRNLASSLFLTERDDRLDERLEYYDDFIPSNKPKVKGRIVTTLHKAKEVRPLVEKCITIACKGIQAEDAAAEFGTDAVRGSEEWKTWRHSEQWQKWNQAMAPAVTARRRVVQLLDNKDAVSVLFDNIADRYLERPGGYTRIVRLVKPRLGDAGIQAILELVGSHERTHQASEKPAFEGESPEDDSPVSETPVSEEETEVTSSEADAPAEEEVKESAE